MSENTIIAWTENTFNPWMGCTKISAGCAHCYAERLTRDRMGLTLWGANGKRQVTSDSNWKKPVQWNKQAEKEGTRKMTFCASLCDIFEDHPTAIATLPRLWDLIRSTPYLDWQLLTKRPNRIMESLPPDWNDGYANVWLGTSIENMDVAWRADCLREIPSVVRFISYEPALGPLDDLDITGIDWIIYGGESGPNYRAHDPEWPRTMKVKCEKAGVAYFYKQSPAYRTEIGTTLDGESIKQYPIPGTKFKKVA